MANSLIIKDSDTIVIPFITRDATFIDGDIAWIGLGKFHLRVAIKKDGKSVYCEQRAFGNYDDIRWSINHSYPEHFNALIKQVRELQLHYADNHTLGLLNSLHQAEAERDAYAIWDAHHGFSAVSPKQKEVRRIFTMSS